MSKVVDNQNLKPVYLIYSNHRLLLAEAAERLAAKIGGRETSLLDVLRFTAGQDELEAVVTACQSLSFLGGRRLILFQGLQNLAEKTQKELLPLTDYIGNPNPQTILVLTQIVGNDKRLISGFKQGAVYRACERIPEAEISEYRIKAGVVGWIKYAFSKRGHAVGNDVVNYLLNWVGSDLDRLAGEIAKICDSLEAGAAADLSTVKDLVVVSQEAGVFDLIEAVIDRDQGRALNLIETLLDKDPSASHAFSLLQRQFHLILAAKTIGGGLPGDKLASKLGVSQGQAFHLARQARLFSLGALKRATGLLLKADYQRKSSPIPVRTVLESLVVDLAGVSGG